MSYSIVASEMFDSATTSVRHTSVAASIIASLSYDDLDDHKEKVEECNKLLRSLQEEADRRAPTAYAGGLVGKLSKSATSDHKAMITNVSRYFSTSAGHQYRRAVKAGITLAANAVSVGAAPTPQTEKEAIALVAEYIHPTYAPFIGVKKGKFVVEWERYDQRFTRLSEGALERKEKADVPIKQLVQLREALKAAGLDIEKLLEGAA